MSVGLTEYPPFLDGGTYDANTLRNMLIAAFCYHSGTAQIISGILPGAGSLQVSPGSGLQVSVATGYCAIASAAGNTYGGYTAAFTQANNLPVAVADTVNPRIDLVYVLITDNGNSTSSGSLDILTGTPASSPTAPAPASGTTYLPIAQVTVPANATSLTGGNIGDVRTYTVLTGGILPVPAIGQAPAGYIGSYVHDRTSAILWHNPPAGPTQVQLLPFAPVLDVITSQVGSITASVNVASVTFSTPGGIDVKISFSWPGIVGNSNPTTEVRAVMGVNLDGTQIDGWYLSSQAGDSIKRAGGQHITWTNGTQADTPAAGTHTVTVTMLPEYDGTHDVYVWASSNTPIILRVEPVNL
jgi:hypothetical protein